MVRHTYDAKVERQLAVMRVVFPLVGLVIFIGIFGLYSWRLHHFERTVATIEAIWEKEVHRRGVKTVTMAELSFSRTAPTGEPIACRYGFEIGTPRDGFKVGDRLIVVPATGTCQRVDIIGRSEQSL